MLEAHGAAVMQVDNKGWSVPVTFTSPSQTTCSTPSLPPGVSQAWMLSSGLPPDITVQGQQGTWHSLHGLNTLTYLDLGGSHFSAAVWVAHMCPLLSGMTSLQRLMLAHCSIPPGKMQYLLPTLTPTLVELNMDRCGTAAALPARDM